MTKRDAHITKVVDALAKAEKALRPLYNAVYNDNGDITVSGHYDHDEAVSGYWAYRKVNAALAVLPALTALQEPLTKTLPPRHCSGDAMTDREAITKAIEALKPFAEVLEDSCDETDTDGQDLWNSSAAMGLSVGDLRRAAEALAALTALQEQPVSAREPKYVVFDWEYRRGTEWGYARTPEEAERKRQAGYKITPVYVPFDSDYAKQCDHAALIAMVREKDRQADTMLETLDANWVTHQRVAAAEARATAAEERVKELEGVLERYLDT